MLTKRIIPCLDVDNGRVVKGVNFVKLRDAGDPVELARFYNNQGADELVFLDITATSDKRQTVVNLVKEVSKTVFIPFTVGGGIKNIDDIRLILRAGADKVSINSAAIKDPSFITRAAQIFGRQCIVVAIDAKRTKNRWKAYVSGGRIETEWDAIEWAKEAEKRGAGELLVTSMDKDGTKSGYDIELYQKISENTNIPIIASGGAGDMSSINEVFTKDVADAALAASIFHFGEIKIPDLKSYLKTEGVEIRP